MNSPRFIIYTLGCKTNQSESEKIIEALINSGYALVEENEYPDITIINTCTVTSKSDAKARQLIRRMKKKYPSSVLIVTGCFVNFNETFLLENKIRHYFKNKEKSEILAFLKGRFGSFEKKDTRSEIHSRVFVKIQDGCQQNCSYCIVPLVRGGYTSTPLDQIISEIKNKVSEGHEEIVLTGIHIGKYGIELPKSINLQKLIRKILEKTDIKRIRLSSLEINEIDDDLINLLTNKRIARHLHIPLQSGSDKILKIMKRPYESFYFLEKLKKIKLLLHDFAITTDIIVGHPFEEDKDFQDTLRICEEVFFAKLHIFKYSKRTRTQSSMMAGQVCETIKAERSSILHDIGNEMRLTYVKDYIGREMDVLAEKKVGNSDLVSATSSNYIKVFFPLKNQSDFSLRGKLVNVRSNKNKGEVLYADLV
jgi:threonylcarbamoyladenosine tRNA methylthiotransferase MtaB